ncbi:MAG: hypothetical protein M1343_05145 [Chloroflexi bacterium]|nr:hypothetical protein [Chloroflexota bacterium]
MLNSERAVFLVSVLTIGLALSLMISPPLSWLVAVVLTAMVCVGTDQVIHSNRSVHLRRKRYAVTLWILPALLVLGAFLFLRLPFFATGLAVVVGLLATAALLYAVITAQCHTVDTDGSYYGLARFALNLISYLTAFSLFAAIYSSKIRSSVSATAILIISILVCLELLRGTEQNVMRTWIYSFVIGVILGQVTWALNYWVISGLVGGLFLLVVFYVLSGIAQNHLLGKLSARLAVEFGVVALAGLSLAMTSGFWLQTT